MVGIGAGSRHSFAIVGIDLSLRVWGANTQGQLGDGGLADRTAPHALSGLTNVRMADGAVSRTVVALLDGSIKVWGAGVTAQGGSSLEPIAAPGNATASQVATAGASHNLAFSTDGVIWGWKDNGAGQLGDGTLAERLEAVRVTEPGVQWKAGTPRFSLAGGEYSAGGSVTITTVTASATIRYSLDGSDPAASPLTIASGGTVAITKTMTLKAIATAAGVEASNVATASYTMVPDAPTLTPGGGAYITSQSVTMTAAQPLTAMYYTTDGSEPAPDVGTTQRYAGSAVTVAASTTIKARAYHIDVVNGPPNPDWTPSVTTVVSYTIVPPPVTPPTIEPATAAYAPPVLVTMSHPESSAIIRYTLDGAEPSALSDTYPPAGLAITPPKIVKAKAFLSGQPSATTTAGYGVAGGGAGVGPFPRGPPARTGGGGGGGEGGSWWGPGHLKKKKKKKRMTHDLAAMINNTTL